MKTGRRFFLSGLAVAWAGAKSILAGSQRQGPPNHIPGFPDASDSGAPSSGLPPMPEPVPDPKAQLKENQKNLRKDADHLLDLAKQLKEEAEKTNQTDVLSLSLVKKAEEVEKLARQIKDLARAF